MRVAWAFEVSQKMGLRSVAFWPARVGLLATMPSIPKLVWNCNGDSKMQEIIYNFIVKNNKATDIAEFIICNSFYEIELPVFGYAPKILPVGQLLTGQRFGKPVRHFWPEDQIKSKVEELLGIEEFCARALILKELARKSINKRRVFV